MKKGIVLVLALVLVSCGQNKGQQEKLVRGGGGDRSGAAGAAGKQAMSFSQASNTGIWGLLTPQQGSIKINAQNTSLSANDVTRAFLYTDWPAEIVGATTTQSDIGWIPKEGLSPRSCTQGICEARVTFGVESGDSHQPLQMQSNQTINQILSSNQRTSITDGGITLGFWDNLVGTTMDGVTLTAIPVYVPVQPQSSYVQGRTIVMVFSDNKGSITANGTVDNSGIYSGTIAFQNIKDHAGNPFNSTGTLGNFQIHVCSMFRCQ